jgi:hypothetical protein
MPVQPYVNEVGRDHLPHRPVRGIGLADRDVVLAQTSRDLIVEPRGVAEFDRVPHAPPVAQRARKRFQALHVAVEVVRQLPKDRRKFGAEAGGSPALEPDCRQRVSELCCASGSGSP